MVWMVPKGGLEPPCEYSHNALNVACLPISPLRRFWVIRLDVDYHTVSQGGCQEDCRPFSEILIVHQKLLTLAG